jgi:hypothetical protein
MKFLNYKAAGAGFGLLSLFVVIIETLVIAKILPYDLIGGGRLENYNAALLMAIFSIVVLVAFSLIVLSEVERIQHSRPRNKISSLLLWLICGVLLLNIGANLLGTTWFEKIVMTIICLLQIAFVLVVIKNQRKLKK